ncbi:hypothetical protein [Vibrio parahaemolyticus]|uniref:hypothetical protein n=1 Tax=Vibrio parahaemolyticus TaxID=670 RepID=UPI000813B3D3|nr:hypothetical protein [Vibrio parahaemolyticus]OCP68360.1 hypothetical protein AKH08_16220 [Vibrio parahaemolyticus]
MDRSLLIRQLETALELARTETNDEIEFDIEDSAFHIIFDDPTQKCDNKFTDEEYEEWDDEDNFVRNITYLGEWLGEYLDIQPRLSFGVFQAEDPKKTGVAYEYGEGEQLAQKLKTIHRQSEVWYLSIYSNWSRPADSVFNDFYKKMKSSTGIGTIDLQVAMLRLIPSRIDEESIESLSPPLQMKETYPELNVAEEDAFHLLEGLYMTYQRAIED